MKNVVVMPNPKKDAGLAVTKSLCDKLHLFGADVYINEKYGDLVSDWVKKYTEFPASAELIIVVGGDGSILDASVVAIKNDVPILGVNLGKVGYLSEVEPDNLDILHRILVGQYTIEKKMLLSAFHVGAGVVEKADRLAVNDVIVSHDNSIF